ncbi:MAG: MATE family efflux transporter [Sedimentisphaerales bacterium]
MIKKLLSSQLRLNMASGVGVTVINAVAMAVAFPMYLHFLGYEKYGVWLVLATVLSFARLGNLGIDQAVMKLVAEEHGRGDIEGVQRYVTTALALLCLSGVLVLLLVLIFKTQIIGVFKLSEENAQTALWLLPYIGILSIYVFIVQALNATLSGLGRIDLANYIQSIGRIVAVTVVATLLFTGRGIESLLIGNTLSYVFIHIVSLICISHIAHIRLLRIRNLDAQRGKRILRFGSGIFGGTVVSMLGSPFLKLMLSRYAGVSTIPIYEIAFRGSMQFRGLIEAGFRAFMPEISRISANMTKCAKDRISQLNRRAMKLINVFGIPMYTAMLIFTAPLLRVWLREEFIQIIPLAFRLMLVATFINLLGVPSYYILLGMGRVRTVFAARCISWLTSMALVTMIAVNRNYLSVPVVCMCLIISWSLSSIYLIWRFRSAMLIYGKTVSSIEEPMFDIIHK